MATVSLLSRLLGRTDTITPSELADAEAELQASGKRASDQRLRGMRERLTFHRRVEILLAGTLAVAILGIVDLAIRPQDVRVAVIPVDGATHRVLNATLIPANERGHLDPRIIDTTIQDWVEHWHTVLLDTRGQMTEVNKVYAHIDGNDPIRHWLDSWYVTHDPRERAKGGESVTAEIRSSIKESDLTYMIFWTEVVHMRDGGETRSTWRSRITAKVAAPPEDPAQFRLNPFGIWIVQAGDPQQESQS